MAQQASQQSLGAFSPSFHLSSILGDSLEKMLPEDIHERASGRLYISMTKIADRSNLLVHQFSSKQELLEALRASSFVPFMSGWRPPRFRGDLVFDGGYSDNLPVFCSSTTITVSPFAGDASICPQDDIAIGSLLNVNIPHGPSNSSNSFHLSKENSLKMISAVVPPGVEGMERLCSQGYQDAMRFLEEGGHIRCGRECWEQGGSRAQQEGVAGDKQEKVGAKQEEVGTKQEIGADAKQEEGRGYKQEKGTEAKQVERTEAKQEERTEAKQEEGTEAKQEEGTEDKQEERTEAKQEEGTEDKQEEGTEAKQEEGTEAKQEVRTEANQDVRTEARASTCSMCVVVQEEARTKSLPLEIRDVFTEISRQQEAKKTRPGVLRLVIMVAKPTFKASLWPLKVQWWLVRTQWSLGASITRVTCRLLLSLIQTSLNLQVETCPFSQKPDQNKCESLE